MNVTLRIQGRASTPPIDKDFDLWRSVFYERSKEAFPLYSTGRFCAFKVGSRPHQLTKILIYGGLCSMSDPKKHSLYIVQVDSREHSTLRERTRKGYAYMLRERTQVGCAFQSPYHFIVVPTLSRCICIYIYFYISQCPLIPFLSSFLLFCRVQPRLSVGHAMLPVALALGRRAKNTIYRLQWAWTTTCGVLVHAAYNLRIR